MEPIEQTRDGDPWSEVPADVQELLKAEMARRQPSADATAPTRDAPKTKGSTRKKSTTKAETADASAGGDAQEAPKPKRSTRKKATPKTEAAEA
jgi:hypothetical protein